MGKHVCPVCEDVYAIAARVRVALDDVSENAEAWGCPRCQYTFVSVEDLVRLVRRTAESGSAGFPSVDTTLLDEPRVVWKPAVSLPSV